MTNAPCTMPTFAAAPVDQRLGRPGAGLAGEGEEGSVHAAALIVEDVAARRREQVVRHVVFEHCQIAGDRDLGLRPADAVDRRDAALEHQHPVRPVGQRRVEEHPVAFDMGAVERAAGDRRAGSARR